MVKRGSQETVLVVKAFRPEEIEPAITKLRRRLTDIDELVASSARYDGPSVATTADRVRATILEVFGQQSPEYQSHQHFAFWRPDMILAGEPDHAESQQEFVSGVEDGRTVLRSLISTIEEKRQDLGLDPRAAIHAAFRGLQLHPRIAAVVRDLFRDGHYRNAVLDAGVALVNFVRERSRVHDRDGVALMQQVFSVGTPVLAFNELRDQTDRDEQQGMMFLFSGAVSALRNPRAHDLTPDSAEYALECIAFLSFLAKQVERARRTAP